MVTQEEVDGLVAYTRLRADDAEAFPWPGVSAESVRVVRGIADALEAAELRVADLLIEDYMRIGDECEAGMITAAEAMRKIAELNARWDPRAG